MFTVFLVIQVLVTIALIGLILIQRSDSDGLGGLGGGGGANAFMTGRGAANLLTRSTAILATVFMLNSLWLAIMSSHSGSASRSSIADKIESGKERAAPAVPLADEAPAPSTLAPVAPVVPEAAVPVEAAPVAEEKAAEDAAPVTSPASLEAVEPVETPAAPAEPAQ